MSQTLQGCHKCGGHPQHPTESLQRYKIFKCNQCLTLTCNQHIIGLMGNTCPSCHSSSLTCLMTRDDHKKTSHPKSKSIKITAKPSGGSFADKNSLAESSSSGTATSVFGIGSPFATKNAANIGSATFTAPESQPHIPEKTLAAEFVNSMTGGGLDKLKAQMATAAIEHHDEHAHIHDHQHTHSHQGHLLAPAEADSKPLELVDHQSNQLKATVPTIQQVERTSGSSAQEEQTPASIETPEELPDPASLRSGITVYADTCFRPSIDDKFLSLGKLLEQINTQLTSGKDMKVVTLALDFYDVKKALPELMAFLQKFPFVRLAVGYGPKHAADDDLDFAGLRQFINTTPHVIALDTGLDLHFAAYSKNAQVTLLRQQIELANHLGKPIFLSAVKADDVLEEAIHQPVKGVYTSPLQSEAALNLCKKHSLWVCARSEVTHSNQDVYRQLLAKIPTGKLLLGSGSELVAPAGQKSMTNSPLLIDDTARVLMQLYRYQKLETLYSQCYKNLYGLLMGM